MSWISQKKAKRALWQVRGGGWLLGQLIRRWMSTLDYQVLFYDPSIDPASQQFNGPCVYLVWHEYIPFLFYLRPHCQISLLLSRHGDAEWLAQAVQFYGFGTVRGSTARGGVTALREMMRVGEGQNLVITPDGPRGPRRSFAAGAIMVSSSLGIPLVPIGLGYDRPWRIRKSWDQFAVPRPGSRARVVAGPRISIPGDLDREAMTYYRQRISGLLECLSSEAEQWAHSNQRPAARIPLSVQQRPRPTNQSLELRTVAW